MQHLRSFWTNHKQSFVKNKRHWSLVKKCECHLSIQPIKANISLISTRNQLGKDEAGFIDKKLRINSKKYNNMMNGNRFF